MNRSFSHMHGLVRCVFFQYYLYGGGALDPTADTGGGLLDALNPEGIRVNCACHTAPIAVAAFALSDQPKYIEDGWDTAAEVDVQSTGAITLVDGDLQGGLDGFGNLASAGAGLYRVRCYARNRAAAKRHRVLTEPIEGHLLQVWPALAAAPLTTLFDFS